MEAFWELPKKASKAMGGFPKRWGGSQSSQETVGHFGHLSAQEAMGRFPKIFEASGNFLETKTSDGLDLGTLGTDGLECPKVAKVLQGSKAMGSQQSASQPAR